MEKLVFERTFNAPIQLVWDAISDRNRTKEWYFPFGEDFKPEVGAVFEWSAKDNEGVEWLHRGEILEVSVPNKLIHSWEYPGYSGTSKVSWFLEEKDKNVTHLTLIHEFTIPFDSTVQALKMENFNGGWTAIVHTLLKDYLEKVQD